METYIIKENTISLNKNRFLKDKLYFQHSKTFNAILLLQSKKLLAQKFIILLYSIIFFLNLIIVDQTILYDDPDFEFIQNLTVLISILTLLVFLVYFICIFIHSKIKQLLAQKSMQASTLSLNSICLLILIAIHPNIFSVDTYIYTTWKYPTEIFGTPLNFFFIVIQNEWILIWCTIRYFMDNQIFQENKNFFLKYLKQNKNRRLFKLRYLLKKNSGQLLIIFMIVSGVQLSMLLKISEGVLMEGDEFTLSFWINSFWTVYLNMLTTGYASCYPQTLVGNLIAILSGVFGNVLFSVMLLSFSNFIELNQREITLKKFIEQDFVRTKIKYSASKILQLLFKSYFCYKKGNYDKYIKYKVMLDHQIINFKQVKKDLNYKSFKRSSTIQKRLSIVQKKN